MKCPTFPHHGLLNEKIQRTTSLASTQTQLIRHRLKSKRKKPAGEGKKALPGGYTFETGERCVIFQNYLQK